MINSPGLRRGHGGLSDNRCCDFRSSIYERHLSFEDPSNVLASSILELSSSTIHRAQMYAISGAWNAASNKDI